MKLSGVAEAFWTVHSILMLEFAEGVSGFTSKFKPRPEVDGKRNGTRSTTRSINLGWDGGGRM